MKSTLTSIPLCDLTKVLQNRHLRTLATGANRDVLALSTATPIEQAHFFDKTHTHQFDIHRWHNGEVTRVSLPPGASAYHYLQPVGNGYICVDARCGAGELNAQVFDVNGVLLHSWHAGDGIEDVQVTPDEQIWVSYFDEGVYSGISRGHQGLNAFDSLGNCTFGYLDLIKGKHDLGPIDDCYALNVSSNSDTWLFYYSDFPLVHLVNREIHQVFEPPREMVGAHSFAVLHSKLLFRAGYRKERVIFWYDLISKKQVELDVVDANGEPLVWERTYGRGADLFLCQGAKVWMLSLNDIDF